MKNDVEAMPRNKNVETKHSYRIEPEYTIDIKPILTTNLLLTEKQHELKKILAWVGVFGFNCWAITNDITIIQNSPRFPIMVLCCTIGQSALLALSVYELYTHGNKYIQIKKQRER